MVASSNNHTLEDDVADKIRSLTAHHNRSTASAATSASTGSTTALLEIEVINKLFKSATWISVGVWLLLLAICYMITPRDEWMYLSTGEREASKLACYMFAIATTLVVIPFFVQRRITSASAIVHAAVATQMVALLTNAIMAFFPTVVRVDHVTGARVFLARWCEWIPLAGLMTFFSEAVDLPKDSKEVRRAILASLCQSISCLFGVLCAFCPDYVSWSISMFFSITTFLVIFPRVITKRRRFLSTNKGSTFMELEKYDRVRFAYELIAICAIVWSVLVLLYVINMTIHWTVPEGHFLRHDALAMGLDAFFDVLAKSIYMKVIMDVHFAVFDHEGRASRQLGELKSLMSVLWDTSLDVIIISVCHDDKRTSIISPSFPTIIGASLPPIVRDRKAMALFLQTEKKECEGNPQSESSSIVTASHYIDSSGIPYGGLLRHARLADIDSSSPLIEKATGVIAAAWNHGTKNEEERAALKVFPCERIDYGECSFELKVSKHGDDAIIAVVRDVTERYMRFEAERKAHHETLARQKDAQSQTRFVRHEVKNGLLAGIELCDTLRSAIDDMEKSIQFLAQSSEYERSGLAGSVHAPRRHVEDLEITLHEVLDTVLAEAMARDVVHEMYKPRLERLDVVGLISSCTCSKVGRSDRFPIEADQSKLPYLQLDPQLLRYIHRNAISNACKYGKQGGIVTTRLSYEGKTKQFLMEVINEPGSGHQSLMELGEDAAQEGVFGQGSTLHSNVTDVDRYISSGDGAWIMQKCAKTMNGCCSIKFDENYTLFSFSCPAEPLTVVDWPQTKDFEVPIDTYGIAIDDSAIQRKLMGRILAHAGVEEEKRIILGKGPDEVMALEGILYDLLKDHPKSKILILIDENLDFGVTHNEHIILSGSLVMKGILDTLSAESEKRIFSLVRSANDSAEDVSLYLYRTHGFFPKAPMQRDRVREILAPLWAERFLSSKSGRSATPSMSNDPSEDDSVEKEDLLASLSAVDTAIYADATWSKIWGSLHALKGDLMVIDESGDLLEVFDMIESFRGESAPENFDKNWGRAKQKIESVINSYARKS